MKTINKPTAVKRDLPTFNLGERKVITMDGQEYKEVDLALTREDTLAYKEFNKYFYNKHLRYPTVAERINGILDIADSLPTLSLGSSELAFMKQPKFVPVERLEQLQREAKGAGESINTYLRAVFYSVGQHLKEQNRIEQQESRKQAQTSRNIASTYYVTPVERKAIEAKHGAMSEKQLQDFLHKFARQQIQSEFTN